MTKKEKEKNECLDMIRKFVNPILTSLAIEDLGTVFGGGDVFGRDRCVVVGRCMVSGSSSGH